MSRPDTRFQDLLRELREQIDASFTPGESLPTKRELASLYGVGTRTIERALKVLNKDGLVTVRPRIGSFKAQRPAITDAKRQFSVGILSRRSADEWPGCEIYPALEAEAQRREIEVVPFANRHFSRHTVGHNLIELTRAPWNKFDVGLLVEAEQTVRLRSPLLLNRKVLAVDFDASEVGIDSIVFANAQGGALAARQFLEHGHTRFAVTDEVTDRGYSTDPANMTRRHGFEFAMGEAGGTLLPQWRLVVPRRASISNRFPFVAPTVAAWAALPPAKRPTALFVTDHKIFTEGKFFDELNRHNLRVPRDLSIIMVTWGGTVFGGSEPVYNNIRMACIDFDLNTLVRRVYDAAAELAEEKRAPRADTEQKEPRRRPHVYLAPARFLPGDSIAPPR